MIEEYKNRLEMSRVLYGEESIQYQRSLELLKGMEAQFKVKKEKKDAGNVRKSRKA